MFCGVPDNLALAGIELSTWRKRALTWAVQGSLPAVFSPAVIAQAFDSWAAVCGLGFAQTPSLAQADVLLTSGPIDGPRGTLAWSELPTDPNRRLQQRYDQSEAWVVSDAPGPGQIDALAVLVHEIGHALGLDHGQAGIMRPTYDPRVRTPQPADVARIQALYGPPAAPAPPGPGEPIVIRIWGAEKIEIPGYRVTKL